MRIGQIVSTFPPYKGGMGNAAAGYARLLAERGHAVTTFTPDYGEFKNQEDDLGDKEAKHKPKVIRLKPFLKYGNAAFLPRIFFRLKNFDAIILHYPFFGAAEVVWLARALKMFKGKFVLQYHMDIAGLPAFARVMSWPSRVILPGLIKNADAVLCSSYDYIAESAIKGLYKKYSRKFHELPFGVDLKKFYPANNASGEIKSILFVGGLDKAHYFKGLKILLESVNHLSESNFQLKIVGKGELRPQYEKMARDLKIDNKVKFLGSPSSEDLPKIYRQCDIFVLPSVAKGEAFGLVLLEAIASGVPVIASNLPGVRTVFTNGREGFFVEPKNAEILAEKLSYLLTHDDERVKMGQAGRKLAEKRYDWEKIGDALNDIFMQ